MIRKFAVGENVDKKFSLRPEPARDLCEQKLVVFHVLEHLDGYHPVKCGIAGLEFVHVRSDNPHVSQSALLGLGEDVDFLRGGIRNTGDVGIRKLLGHPERQASPSAPEFENVLSIHEASPLAAHVEHRLLGFGECRVRMRPVAAAVFHARPQDEAEKFRGNLVVLLVSGSGFDRNRARF